MGKTRAYASMFLVLLGILAGDAWLLTRADARRMLVEGKLRELMGDLLLWGSADIALDGTVSLEETKVFTPKRLLALAAERAEIRMGLGGLEQVRVEGFRGSLTGALIQEVAELRGPERPIRELFPNADRMPSLRARRGRLEVQLPAIFAGAGLQALEVRDLRAVPLGSWRYTVTAEASHELFGTWTLRGDLDLDKGTQRIRAEGRGLQVTRAWREALVPAFQAVYDHYQAEGLCDVVVDLSRGSREQPLDVKVTVTARDMKVTYFGFPYPAERVHGEIEFTPRGFSIKEMRGYREGRLLKFDGDAQGYSHASALDFRFESDALPIDAAIRAALPKATREVVDLFAASGTVDVRGRVVRPAGGHESIPLDLHLRDVDVTYAPFPYRLRRLNGLVHVDGQNVQVRGVTARDGAMTMTVSGEIGNLGADPRIDLRIEAERLPLDAKLKAALDAEARKSWDLFNPSGEVDVRWRVRKEPGRPLSHSSRTRCLGNKATFKEIPLPVTDLRGELEMEGSVFRLNHLVGRVRGGEVEAHGVVDAETMSVHLDGTGIPLDDQLKSALPEELARLLRDLNVTGTAAFNAGLVFRKDARQVDLVCRLSQGSLGTETRFEEVEGTITLTGYAGADSQYIGFTNLSHAKLWGKRLTDVGASFSLKGHQLGFSNLKGTSYGGMFSGKSFLVNLETKDYAAEGLVLDGLDLNLFTKDTQSYADKAVGGKVRLELPLLKGNAKDAATAGGKGRMIIRDALLWDIPVFLKFFTLNPGELLKEKRQFDAGALEFEIKERRFEIKRLAFTSESVSMVGEGKVNFDGSLHVTLRPKSGPLLGIDFFILKWAGDLMSLVLGSSVKVVVTGTFEKPEVHVR